MKESITHEQEQLCATVNSIVEGHRKGSGIGDKTSVFVLAHWCLVCTESALLGVRLNEYKMTELQDLDGVQKRCPP